MHNFRDIAFHRSKIAIFGYPSFCVSVPRRSKGFPWEIYLKFSVDVNGWPRYQMAQKNCRKFQPVEYGARVLQTDDRQTDRRQTNGRQHIVRSRKSEHPQNIHFVSKRYHPTTNDNFNNSYPIPVILVHILLSKYAIKMWFNIPPHLFIVRTLPWESLRP